MAFPDLASFDSIGNSMI